MINRILMELYDEYINNNIESLKEFAKKTFNTKEISELFICCTLIMFSQATCFKSKYDCTRENLLSIVLAAKENVENVNLLKFYIDRVNTFKGINKYFDLQIKDEELEKNANVIINYLNKFKPDFIGTIKQNEGKSKKYFESKNR